MIRYDLTCEHGHAFDAWFASSAAYDEQVAAGLVQCPVCGSPEVRKQLMSPAVATRRDTGARSSSSSSTESGRESGRNAPSPALLDERARAVREFIGKLHRHVRENADYVGRAFAEEARKRARQENARPVWGEASAEEVSDLLDSGVEVLPLPPLPDKRN